MHHISDIATDPNITWSPSAIPGSNRYVVQGVRERVKIKVIIEAGGKDIVTAHPIP